MLLTNTEWVMLHYQLPSYSCTQIPVTFSKCIKYVTVGSQMFSTPIKKYETKLPNRKKIYIVVGKTVILCPQI